MKEQAPAAPKKDPEYRVELSDDQKGHVGTAVTDLLTQFADEKAKLIKFIKSMVTTWVREPNKRFFELTTPMIKSFVEKNADALRTFVTSVGFTQTQTSQTRYQFIKSAEPAESNADDAEAQPVNVFSGNVEVLETIIKVLEEEEKKLA